jgi:beta-xylosidase
MKRVAPSVQFLTALGALAVAGLACALPGQAPTIDEVILEPTLRPLEAPATPAPAVQAPTEPPSEPQMASSAFRDDFDGTMDIAWTWFKGPEPGYSLTHTPGWLRLNLSPGSFLSATPPENLLLRPAPGASFDLSTYLRFSPHNNFEIAGLVVVFDDDSVLQFGRGGCFLEAPTPSCIGDGLYFDNLQDGSPVGGNFASPAALGLDYSLRLQRTGNTYTASYTDSSGGSGTLGSHTVDGTPVSIGLIAAQATVAQPYADFDYFEMSQP